MFVIFYKAKGKPIRYYHPTKGLQKTIKTAWAFPEAVRSEFEGKGLSLRTIPASPVAETMYPNGVQRNQIRW